MAASKFFLFPIIAFAALVAGCAKDAAPKGGGQSSGGGGRGGGQPQAVEVASIVRRDLYEILPAIGSLAPNESAEIRPEATGLIRTIFFEEGQRVKQGDILMKIDDSELLAQYAQVEARFKLAELNVARSESLSESRTIPQSEADRARSEFSAARAELSLLKLRLEKTEVKAPFDGVVESRTISAGDYVTASTILTRINDLSRMKITFQVPERHLSKVRPGTPFQLRDSNTETLVNGEVYFVNNIIDRATRSSEVKGFLTNPSEALKPGMFATVEIVLEVRKNALTVPESSILASPTGTQIILVKDVEGEKVAEFVPVELGLRARGYVEIRPLEGIVLPELQPVVASGVGGIALYPGIKLAPRPLRAELRQREG